MIDDRISIFLFVVPSLVECLYGVQSLEGKIRAYEDRFIYSDNNVNTLTCFAYEE